jgi:hypothetical protein
VRYRIYSPIAAVRIIGDQSATNSQGSCQVQAGVSDISISDNST